MCTQRSCIRRLYFWQRLFCCLFALTILPSCENFELAEEGTGSGTNGSKYASSVRILTRGAEENSLDYPLHVYAFASDGKLVAQQLIEDASTELRISVPRDADTRIVVISADPSVYEIPSNPTKSSLITMKAGGTGKGAGLSQGYSTKALQMGYVNLHPRTDNSTVSIQLQYKVASLEVTLTDMPKACKSAFISVESTASAINLSEEFQGTQLARIPLYALEDGQPGTYTTGTTFLFPTSGTTRFTITYNDGQVEQTSTADYQAPLLAGIPYRINAAYDDGCLHVSGTVSPSEWSDPIDIGFEFSNGSSTTVGGMGERPIDWENDTTIVPVNYIPQPFTLWENHLVVAVGDLDEEESGYDASTAKYATLLLLSRSETADNSSAFGANPDGARNTAGQYEEEGLAGWRIPTISEATLLSQVYRNDSQTFNAFLAAAHAAPITLRDENGKGIRYLCDEATKTFAFYEGVVRTAGASVNTYCLRLVRTVRVRLQ